MLLFLNIDCLLPMAPLATEAADAAGLAEPLGLPGFEAVLDIWPPLQVVITSELRYRMTIEQLRSLFAPRCRPRVIATSLLYGALAHGAALGREQEILHWLRHAGAESADWLALDHRHADFQRHADRLVACARFDRAACADLNARLLQRAGRQRVAADLDHHAVAGAPAGAAGGAAPFAGAWV